MNRALTITIFAGATLFAQPAPIPPKLRLGDAVRPTHYTLDLKVVPTEDRFSGTVDIDIELRAPASVLWLNGQDLKVSQASLGAGGRTVAARPITGNQDFLGFTFERPVEAGKATLHVVYEGAINSKSSAGIFKNKDGDDWYAFTQFESIDARRAFPCFDEPSFKTPWQVTLHVKKEHMTLSNTPIVAETDEPGGMKAVRFAETRPLPSYLVAFATGPFEAVDAGKAGQKGTPLRIIALKGRSAEAKYAAEVTPQLLTQLENYFGIPYPYEKLDSIAVPLFFGAMENPGLVTYGDTIILAKPREDSIGRQRDYASTAAHEMAHMWFGDLVTTAWWNDIWLNEAFATWMASKTVAQWKPEWKADISAAAGRQGSMGQDSLISARQIRQPVESNNDIANAFDGITYGKGAAVIHMFEQWIGPDQFRRGVQIYLKQHAFGNATAADFLKAESAAAERDISTAFSTFLDQAGVPLVSFELKCGAGKPALALSQKRFLPLGSKGSAEQVWQIPVCYKYGDGKATRRVCTLLVGPRAEMAIPSAESCPAWLEANADEAGYYRVLYKGDLLERLTADGGERLTPAERIGMIGDVQAAVQGGDLPAGDALRLVPEFANDPVRQVVASTAGIVWGIRTNLVPDELRPNYARFVEKIYGERAHALGWHAKPGEDDDTKILRSQVVGLVASEGEDKPLIEQAQQLASRWFDDRKAIQPEMVELVLSTAAENGNRALYDRFVAELKKATDPRERQQLLEAMSSFRNPEIVKANFALLLSGGVDIRESTSLLFGPLQYPQTRALPFEWVRNNYDEIVEKLPRQVGTDYSAFLPYVTSAFCDERHHAEAEAFFQDRAAKAKGGPRNLAQALEAISLCTAMKKAQEPAVAEFLRKY